MSGLELVDLDNYATMTDHGAINSHSLCRQGGTWHICGEGFIADLGISEDVVPESVISEVRNFAGLDDSIHVER